MEGENLNKYRQITEQYSRIFVIGDVHGCAQELSTLLDLLYKDKNLSTNDLVIFIGDYIDRGIDSKGVIDLLLKVQRDYPDTIFLRGNHEEMILDFLGFEGEGGDVFLKNGGTRTLASYGIDSERIEPEEIAQVFPREHLSFLLNTERYVIFDNYICVHAGLSPLRDIRAQLDKDIFWIRDDFINNVHFFEKIVVFGHTPYKDVLLHLPYKIGIDTGAVYGNKLSCVELVNNEIIQVKSGTLEVFTRSFKE